jgi:hypothetical protein
MKYKNRLKKLDARKKQYDSFPKDVQQSQKRPGSEKK